MPYADTKIAVVMRSYNDIDVIEKTLDMLARQTIRTFELWNFDSSSTDGTLEVLQKFNHRDKVLLNDPKSYNPGRILNEAVEVADAEILVFLNSDATPVDEHWLERLIEPLMDPTIGAVFGRQVARSDCRSLFIKDTERAFGDGKEAASWLHFFSMANSAARSSVLKRFPFKTSIQYSEDTDWSYRLRRGGYRVRYVPDAVVTHSHNYTLRQSYKRHYGEGRADASIFCEGEINRSFMRYCMMPFAMEVLRDIRWAVEHQSVDAALHTIPLRLTQKWSRWRGIRAGIKRNANSHLFNKTSTKSYTFDGNKKAEDRIALDQSIISTCVTEAIPGDNFEALVLIGGYARAEGGYCLIEGQPAPYNDYDYYVVVKNMSRKSASQLQEQLKEVAHRLSVIVGIEVDLAVMRKEALKRAPFTLMNAEMKWGHRVIAGKHSVLDTMPAMPFDKIALGEFTRLMNNRGALLLMNARKLASGKEIQPEDREVVFKYLFKAILACGDAVLAMDDMYHPSYVEKQKRMRQIKYSPSHDFKKLYKQAIEQKFYPNPDLYTNENIQSWQQWVTYCWLETFSKLESQRSKCSIKTWSDYAQPELAKGQLEAAHVFRNFAITLRDFGAKHTLRYFNWAWRYPRERLISVLPLLLRPVWDSSPEDVAVPLAVSPQSEWSILVERYLQTWKRYA